ncbi:MAG: flagellar hook-associated protein 3 [Salinisphaeraceae bacterium]|jgi:flagellar hook-associated protein 3 FlgL|nr:flagellar hook-associated protein 3 [Salinisphaeraceae bacterium]
MRVSTTGLIQSAIDQMLRQQGELAKTRDSLASGQRYTRAAENPGAVATAARLDSVLSQLGQYRANGETALSRLTLEEGALDTAGDILQRMRELVVQGNNATASGEARSAIATEMRALEDELLSVANAQDGRGRYLFAGLSDAGLPFSRSAGGQVSYGGDGGERQVNIGQGRSVADGDSGDAVFMRVPSGNGLFQVTADPANQGGATLKSAQPDGSGAYSSQRFDIEFVGGGYQVLDEGGAVVQAAAEYEPGSVIEFGGVSVSFSGTPAAGDNFSLDPLRRQSVFDLAGAAVNALSLDDAAQRGTGLYNALEGLDAALGHINEIRGTVGARMNAIERSDSINEGSELEIARSLSGLRDVDMAEAIGRLTQQATTLEAAQAAFARVQNLSLFDFLR